MLEDKGNQTNYSFDFFLNRRNKDGWWRQCEVKQRKCLAIQIVLPSGVGQWDLKSKLIIIVVLKLWILNCGHMGVWCRPEKEKEHSNVRPVVKSD